MERRVANLNSNESHQWALFYLRNRRALTTYALCLAGNDVDAADLIQDVLLRLLERSSETPPRAFALRCLRNAAIDRRRRSVKRSTEPLGVTCAFLADATARAADGDLIDAARSALMELKPMQREIVVLKVYADMTFREIGAVLETPLGTVASHYTRAIAALRTALTVAQANERGAP